MKHKLQKNGNTSPSHAWLVCSLACCPTAIITKWNKLHSLLKYLRLLKCFKTFKNWQCIKHCRIQYIASYLHSTSLNVILTVDTGAGTVSWYLSCNQSILKLLYMIGLIKAKSTFVKLSNVNIIKLYYFCIVFWGKIWPFCAVILFI